MQAFRLLVRLAPLTPLWILCPPAAAQSVTYELHATSDYVQGCYEPCDCPLTLFENLGGVFELTYDSATPDGFDHYLVDQVAWTIGTPQGPLAVSGSGSYSIGGQFALSQRLQLDLSIDGEPAQAFDSGLQIGGSSFPVIDLAISMNGLVCFDRVFDLNAAPLSVGSAHCTAAPNSVGAGANIKAVGSPVVAADDLHLLVQGAPPQTFGLFFFASNPTQLPLGEGFLCATGSLRRLPPPLQSDPDGNRLRKLLLSQPPAAGLLLPGSTWSFQYWYRDQAGGPSGFNLSDAVAVSLL